MFVIYTMPNVLVDVFLRNHFCKFVCKGAYVYLPTYMNNGIWNMEYGMYLMYIVLCDSF